MIHLNEGEFGYDPETVGFPSIGGCHAVGYLTEDGFYGFHNAGGSAETEFERRAKWFADFAKENFVKAGKGVHLYSVSSRSTQNNRGYGGNKLKPWQDEMKAYAKALGYKGPVTGYDVDKQPNWPQIPNSQVRQSAYVEFKKGPNGVVMAIKPWNQCASTMGACTNRANHKIIDKVANKPIALNKQVTLTVTPQSALIVIPTNQCDTLRV